MIQFVMTYQDIIDKHSYTLENITHTARKEVQILLCHILKKDITYLHKHSDQKCDIVDEIMSLIDKRATGYPIEYITNDVCFYSEQFFISDGVLVPRPETELLVDEAIKILRDIPSPTVLEIGCGSGVVSIMLAKMIPNITITAVDISQKAIENTQTNITLHNQGDNIKVIKSDLYENICNQKFDMVVSNPPYIQAGAKLHKSLSHEPDTALYGGEIGDELLKKIIKQFFTHDTRYLICEIGYDQKDSLSRYFKNFPVKWSKFYKDLAHHDRGFVLERL